MPVLNVKMDNILIFNNFKINFTYPQKINSFLVKDEHLRDRPSFRYKKVNIFIGSNASGKTLLMRSLWNILLFLREKEEKSIKNIVHNFKKEANIEIDLTENNFLYRIKIKINVAPIRLANRQTMVPPNAPKQKPAANSTGSPGRNAKIIWMMMIPTMIP